MKELMVAIRYTLPFDLKLFVFGILGIKFYVAQDIKNQNEGWEIISLKYLEDAYFYGTRKDFDAFHRNLKRSMSNKT